LKVPNKRRFLQRSRIDIVACILGHSNDSSRKTRLIYRCNLSLSQFNIYAECLVEGGLLDRYTGRNGVEIYKITEKGKNFLKDYRRLKKVLEEMGM